MNIATTRAAAKSSLSLPNILTYARIAAIPGGGRAAFTPSRSWTAPLWLRWVAVAVFIAAGVTDFLDGYYARIWGQQSAFGRMLDPIADKLLVASCLPDAGGRTGSSRLDAVGRDRDSCAREIPGLGPARMISRPCGSAFPVTKLAKWKPTIQAWSRSAFLIAGEAGEVDPAADHADRHRLAVGVGNFHDLHRWDYFRAGIHHLIKED
jgi:cardiolipin synthase